MKKVLVLGATGYIGKEVCQTFVYNNFEVYGLIRSPSLRSQLPPKVKYIDGDFATIDNWSHHLREMDTIINAAFPSHGGDWFKAVTIEHDFLEKLFENVTNQTQVILMNGTAFLGDSGAGSLSETAAVQQDHPAGIRAKNTSPKHWKKLHSNVVELRFASFIYGKNGSVFLPILISEARKTGESIYVEDGKIYTSTLHVSLTGSACLAAVQYGVAGETYHFANDETPSIKTIAHAVSHCCGPKCKAISVTAEEAQDRLDPFTLLFMQQNNAINSTKARKELNWRASCDTSLLWDVAHGSYAHHG
ncbi:MAG: NAD-dependent epimerase/dehydratase family protein [Bacteroidota bacterium]